MDFCELVADIKGLGEDVSFLDTFIFDSFKKGITSSLDKSYESQHPYVRNTVKELVKIEGAEFIEITFDSNSEIDPRDTVLFSYDEAGKDIF